MKLEELSRRLTVVEVQLEERWKETILRIKRIEAILIGGAGTIGQLISKLCLPNDPNLKLKHP